jgi:hypothetical protein
MPWRQSVALHDCSPSTREALVCVCVCVGLPRPGCSAERGPARPAARHAPAAQVAGAAPGGPSAPGAGAGRPAGDGAAGAGAAPAARHAAGADRSHGPRAAAGTGGRRVHGRAPARARLRPPRHRADHLRGCARRRCKCRVGRLCRGAAGTSVRPLHTPQVACRRT